MSEIKNISNTTPPPTGYQGDFVGVLQVLYKRKWLVILGIIASLVLSLVLATTMPKVYRSRCFVQFSDPSQDKDDVLFSLASQMLQSSQQAVYLQLKDLGFLDMFKEIKIDKTDPESFHLMSVQTFKKYASAFRNYQQFLLFATRNKYLDATQSNNLRDLIPNNQIFSKLIKEVYALSKDDLKNFGQTLIKEKNYVAGADLEMIAHDKNSAQHALTAMGDFIRYCILAEKVSEYTAFQLNQSKTLVDLFASYILNIRTNLELLQKQGEKLQALPYKTSAILNDKIVEIQSRIIDLQRMLASFEMERLKNQLFIDYFTSLKAIMDEKPGSTTMLFNQMEMLKTGFFKTKNKADIVTLLAIHAIDIDVNRFHTFYEKTLQFVSAPTLPSGPEWPRKSTFLTFGFFAGFLFFIALALLLEFWEKYRHLILPRKFSASDNVAQK